MDERTEATTQEIIPRNTAKTPPPIFCAYNSTEIGDNNLQADAMLSNIAIDCFKSNLSPLEGLVLQYRLEGNSLVEISEKLAIDMSETKMFMNEIKQNVVHCLLFQGQ